MRILDTSTPLKIKHIIIVILIAGIIWFQFGLYKQGQMNKKNLEVLVEFLQKASQPQK
jgi:hypothetical protein